MAGTGPQRLDAPYTLQPHAYDPAAQPEYFEGVLARRMVAFCLDFLIISIPLVFMTIFILIFGLFTFGLGWLLYWLFPAGAVIWAVVYYGVCFGGPASATLGMRAVGLEMRTWYGDRAYFLLGAAHAVVYWILVSTLTPLILLVALFNTRRRLLHDMLLGTIVINTEERAQALRRYLPPARPLAS